MSTPAPFIVTSKGKRYNVAKFVEIHPGGSDLIVPYEGKDVGQAMAETYHSDHAYAVLEQYAEDAATRADDSAAFGIDLSKAILPQVLKMEPKVYNSWILSRPHVEDMTLFPNAALEALTRYPWWCIFMWIPIIAYCTYDSVMSIGGTSTVMFFVAGFFTWTLTEYMLHRFLFHMIPTTHAEVAVHFFAHGIHHLIPCDPRRLTIPPVPQVILGLMFLGIMKLGFLLVGASGVLVFWSAFMATYVCYDWLHFAFHHFSCRHPVLAYFKSHHMDHHYKDEHSNFGVSSPLWDYVFGTYSKIKAQ